MPKGFHFVFLFLLCFGLSLGDQSGAWFRGSFVHSATEASLHKGGNKLDLILNNDAWSVSSPAELAAALRRGFVSGCKVERHSGWKANIDTLLCDSCVTIVSKTKAVIVFAAAPKYSIEHPERITLMIPGEVLVSNKDHLGPDVYIMPEERLSFTVLSESVVAGKPAKVQFSGGHLSSLGDGIRVVEGDNCNAPAAATKDQPTWDTGSNVVTITFLTGGTFSLCYAPNVPEDEKAAVKVSLSSRKKSLPYVSAQGKIVVAGPEGYNTDPSVITTGQEFAITFFGTNLTEYDHVVITPEQSCPTVFVESDLILSSTGDLGGKTYTYVKLNKVQSYRICYWTQGSDSFVKLRDLRVHYGGGILVSDYTQTLLVREDTRITDNIPTDFLIIEAGTLTTDHYTVNVTHLDWKGGVITGKGSINTHSHNSRIKSDHKTKLSLESTIRNFGILRIYLDSFDMGDHGTLINDGIVDFIVNDMTSAPATISGSRTCTIVNQKLGMIRFKRLSAELHQEPVVANPFVTIGCSLVNKGRFHLEESFSVHLEAFRGSNDYQTSEVRVSKGSILQVTGVLGGTVYLDNSTLHFRDRFVINEATSIFATGINRSHIVMSGTICNINSVIVKGNMTVVVEEGNYTFHGINIFDINSTVVMKGGTLQGHIIARLNIEGRLLIRVPQVSLGRNLVIVASNKAVFFGEGVKPPIFSASGGFPLGSDSATLKLVENAKLLLLSVPDANKVSTMPSACSDYLVVPVQVEIRGDVLLHGCALFPFGGNHSGRVRPMSENDDDFSDLFTIAMCQHVLRGNIGCHPTQLALPSADGVTGYSLHGHHHLRNDQMMLHNLDVGNGLIEFADHVVLRLSGNFTVGPQGEVYFREGGLIHSGHTHVFGKFHALNQNPVVVNGALTVYTGGRVGVAVGSQDTCDPPPLQINGSATFNPGSYLQCNGNNNNVSHDRTVSVLGYREMSGIPDLDNCHSTDAVKYSTFTELRGKSTKIQNRVAFIIGVAMTSCAIVLLIGISIFQSSGVSAFRRELVLRPPFTLKLRLHEFTALSQNYYNLAYIFLELICLITPAFHPNVPVPDWLHNIFWISELDKRMQFLNTPVVVVVGFWVVSWCPLLFRSSVMKLKAMQQSGSSLFVIYMKYHASTHWWFTTLFFVIAHIMILPFVKFLDDSTVVSTNDIFILLLNAVLLFAFLILVPYSGGNHTFPFAHPPFQRDTDIRLKRSFVHLQHVLFTITISAVYLYGFDVVRMLVCCSVACVALFLVHYHSTPCAYDNINQLRSAVYLGASMISVLNLFQSIKYNGMPLSPCSPPDFQYYILLVVGATITVFCAFFVTLSSTADSSRLPIDDHARASNEMWINSLKKVREAIKSQKAQIFNSSANAQRSLWAGLAALKGEYHTTLNAYRAFKEQYFGVFYLAKLVDTDSQDVEHEKELREIVQWSPTPPSSNMSDCSTEFSQQDLDHCKRGPIIGRGNYGTVYMGMIAAKGIPRLVAIKEISLMPGQFKDNEVQSLKQEIALLKKLSHPNVIRYYGESTSECQMSIVMEFAVGGSLTSLSKRFKRLTNSVIRLYTFEILQGLSYLHRNKIVHRDIKGENILIDSEGHARLADFGCSCLISKTNPTGGVGSPYFMAPEVIRNLPYGTKADIWSIGCTVVEMLNGGNPPWMEHFDNVYTAMMYIGNHSGLPTNIPSDVTAQCKDFLNCCFARNPEERWSADQLLQHPWIADFDSYEPNTRTFIEYEKHEIVNSASSSLSWATDSSSLQGTLEKDGSTSM